MSMESDVVAPLLDAIAASASHAAAIVRYVDLVEGQNARSLGDHDRAAVGLVVSAASNLAEEAGITSDDLPGRSRSLRVPNLGARGDEDSEVVPSDAGNGHPASAGAEGLNDVVLDRARVCAVDRELLAVDHELMVGHDASPSAGESAEPGLASTLSVEGEPAAGASFSEAPAAPSRDALNSWAGEISELVGPLQEVNLALRAAHPVSLGHRGYIALVEARDAQLAELCSVLVTTAPPGTLRLAEAIAALAELAEYPSHPTQP